MSNEANANLTGGLTPLRWASLERGKVDNTYTCTKGHYIYIAEVVYIQRDGKLHVVNVCRACGGVSFHEKQITSPGTSAILLKEKGKEENEL